MHLFSWICETSWLTSPETQVSWTASPMQIGKPQRCLILTNGDFLGINFPNGISRRCCGSMGKFWWNNMSLGCNVTWNLRNVWTCCMLQVLKHSFVLFTVYPSLDWGQQLLYVGSFECGDERWQTIDAEIGASGTVPWISNNLLNMLYFWLPLGCCCSVFHSACWDVLICPTHLPPKKVFKYFKLK